MSCRRLQGIANAAYLRVFFYSALLHVAPYCVPGGIKMVSEVRGSHVSGYLASQPRDREFLGSFYAGVGVETCCAQ